jgi:hypothetical protein
LIQQDGLLIEQYAILKEQHGWLMERHDSLTEQDAILMERDGFLMRLQEKGTVCNQKEPFATKRNRLQGSYFGTKRTLGTIKDAITEH